MTLPLTPPKPASETALQKERRLLRENLRFLRDTLLNRIFDLKPEIAARRWWYLAILFLASGFLITLRHYPLRIWGGYVQDILNFVLVENYTPVHAGEPFSNLIIFSFQALIDPRTLAYLPLFMLSYFIAYQAASFYLADVFELEDIGVARHFISEVALSGNDKPIRITQGDIHESHRDSPNFLIGGPGKVIVDIDSVALFEKPDGTPHVIGPTGGEPRGMATLEGFERFRAAVNLRDHYIELRDQDDKATSVESRSLDGIPVKATDVRFMFSVDRANKKSSPENPYPFSKKAIENMVYKATSRVTPNLNNPSTFEFSWINNMFGLVRSELATFMSQHNLTSYLASIGMPEFEKAIQEEDNIANEAKSIASAGTDDQPKAKDIKPPPEFLARHKLKSLFSQFTEEFANKSRQRGVELHWIGVGTWETDVDVVPEKHLKAWKMSRDNLIKGSEKAYKTLMYETTIDEMINLLREVPVEAYQTATAEQENHKSAERDILISYQKQLKEAKEFILDRATVSPDEMVKADLIQDAIDNITKSFGHVI